MIKIICECVRTKSQKKPLTDSTLSANGFFYIICVTQLNFHLRYLSYKYYRQKARYLTDSGLFIVS